MPMGGVDSWGSRSPGEGAPGTGSIALVVSCDTVPTRGGTVLTVCAGDPRLLPLPAGQAPDGGHVALDEALGALVPHQ